VRDTSQAQSAGEQPSSADFQRAEGRLAKSRRALLDKTRQVVDKESHVAERIRTSTPGTVWSGLNGVDFMNSSLQFAALGVLTLFPFLLIVSAGTGRDFRQTVVTRMGLDHAAAKDVNALISSGNHAVTGLSVLGGLLVLLGAIGIASTLQTWYQRVYNQSPPKRWIRQLANRLLWLGGFVAYLALQELIGRELGDAGAKTPSYVVTFVVALVFYWWGLHVLLLGRIGWRELFPAGLATALCLTGLAVFSALLFSSQIVSSDRDYGSIGVVMVLLSYLIAIGVCLHLGAVVGRAWNERSIQPPSAPSAPAEVPDRPNGTQG
jgi:membrane protein